MENFKVAIINEFEKMYKKKKLIISGVISLIFIMLIQFGVWALRNGFGVRAASSMDFPILVLSITTNTILPLFVIMSTIDSFSGEFSHNTMKLTITKPNSRIKVFAAKFMSISAYSLINLLIMLFFSIIIGSIFNSNTFTFQGFLKVFLAYIITIVPLMVLTLIIITFSNIFKSGVSTFFISIFVFIVFKGIEITFLRYAGILFTSMLNWYNIWIMDSLPLQKIFREFIMMGGYGIIFFTLGYYLFDKKEF